MNWRWAMIQLGAGFEVRSNQWMPHSARIFLTDELDLCWRGTHVPDGSLVERILLPDYMRATDWEFFKPEVPVTVPSGPDRPGEASLTPRQTAQVKLIVAEELAKLKRNLRNAISTS